MTSFAERKARVVSAMMGLIIARQINGRSLRKQHTQSSADDRKEKTTVGANMRMGVGVMLKGGI